jgi:hypothetical protein
MAFGKNAIELAPNVGLPDQITHRDTEAIQMLMDVRSEGGAGRCGFRERCTGLTDDAGDGWRLLRLARIELTDDASHNAAILCAFQSKTSTSPGDTM